MSTMTRHQIKARTISIAPTPCRMIRVEVFELDEDPKFPYGISWVPVIGIASAPNLEFPEHIDVWPVLATDHPEDGELCVADEHRDADNLRYKACVPCYWPPEQDRENAIAIGMKLIAKRGDLGNWVTVSSDDLP
jgi:hypothetical protein